MGLLENRWGEYPEPGLRRVRFKIARTAYFLHDAFTYPPRRRNALWRILESLIGLSIVYWHPVWWAVPVAFVAEFLAYEYIAEPLGMTGYYFERGPREGESPNNDGFWSE